MTMFFSVASSDSYRLRYAESSHVLHIGDLTAISGLCDRRDQNMVAHQFRNHAPDCVYILADDKIIAFSPRQAGHLGRAITTIQHNHTALAVPDSSLAK